MDINIIGTGNVGTVFSKLLSKAGHHVSVIAARELPARLPDSQICILAVSDDHLREVKGWLPRQTCLVVHTAGSVRMDLLEGISNNYGVFYPLQTIRKEMETQSGIPILVNGNTQQNSETLLTLARSISSTVRVAGDDERKKLHLAAVIINNFTNHLVALAQHYCAEEHIDFTVLEPLLSETLSRAVSGNAGAFQTGPAARNDEATLKTQRDMLAAYPRLLLLYDQFTESIRVSSGLRSS